MTKQTPTKTIARFNKTEEKVLVANSPEEFVKLSAKHISDLSAGRKSFITKEWMMRTKNKFNAAQISKARTEMTRNSQKKTQKK